MRALWRLTAWGGCAVGALAAAALAASSEPGTQRLAALARANVPAARGAAEASVASPEEGETRRLIDAVRILAADRDRMLARINSLEQNLDDVTGTINRSSRAGAAAAPAPVTPSPIPANPAAPALMPAWATEVPLLASSPLNDDDTVSPWPDAATGGPDPLTSGGIGADRSVATKTEFGADIGGSTNVGGLKSLWISAKSAYGPLLDRVRPVIAVREVRPGSVELRLVVGPLANAGAAARLCAALTASGRSCRPAIFDGQRLALK